MALPTGLIVRGPGSEGRRAPGPMSPIKVPGPASAETPRQIAKKRAALDHAAKGHAGAAASHRKAAAELKASLEAESGKAPKFGALSGVDLEVGQPDVSAQIATHTAQAELHDRMASDVVGVYRSMAAELLESAKTAPPDLALSLASQAEALRASASETERVLRASAAKSS